MVRHKLRQTNKNKQTSQKKKKKVFAVGRRRPLEHGAQTGKPCGQSGRRPSQGTERGGSGEGQMASSSGGQKNPLMSIHGMKDNGGAAEQGPCRRKQEPGTIYMQPCALWPLDAAQEAAGASLAPTRQLGKPTTSSRFGCLLLRTGEF